jgi:tetratricopeptide (TPR) repeat protein
MEEGSRISGDPVASANLGNVYLQLGRLDDAIRALKQAQDEPTGANLLGLAMLKTGDKAAAEAAFRDAINLQPDLTDANVNLGNLLAERHDYAQAAWHFEKAVAASPANAEARHSYGLVLALSHSWAKARRELEEALRLAPGSTEIRSDLEDLRRGGH